MTRIRICVLFLLVIAADPVRAAQVVFGLSPTTPPTDNPYIIASPGAPVTLYLWARRTGTSGIVNALGLNIKAVNDSGVAIPLPNVSLSILNPIEPVQEEPRPRWYNLVLLGGYNQNVNGEVTAVYDSRAFSIDQTPGGPYLPIQANFQLHGILTFDAPGEIVNLFIGVSPLSINESSGTTTSLFGFDDPAIPSTGFGAYNTYSLLPEAAIVPEPAAIALGIAGATLASLRRRRGRGLSGAAM